MGHCGVPADREAGLHALPAEQTRSSRHGYFKPVSTTLMRQLGQPARAAYRVIDSLRRDDCGQWFAAYTCELPLAPLPATGSSVGVDVGTTWFAITLDGEFVENPRHLNNGLKKLHVQQGTVSRRKKARHKKGSNRRRKAVQIVAKTHREICRQRADFHHKTARRLVNEHDLITHEDLKVGNMVKSTLARSISDVGWASFFEILRGKAASAGRAVIAVNPQYTSQTCRICGHVGKENRMSQSRFLCVQCGHAENADVNAAHNILERAVPSALNGRGVSHAVA